MKQIRVDLCNLPELDGFKYLVVCTDKILRWSEVKAIKDKSAPTTASFLNETICRYGCIKMQIIDEGKELVDQAAERTRTEQNDKDRKKDYFSIPPNTRVVPSKIPSLTYWKNFLQYRKIRRCNF